MHESLIHQATPAGSSRARHENRVAAPLSNGLAFLAGLPLLFLFSFPHASAGDGQAPPATRPDVRAIRPAADRLIAQAEEELRRLPEPRSGDTRNWGRWFGLADIAFAQARLGNLEAAKATADSIREDGLRNTARLDMAVLLARQGKYEQAKAIRPRPPLLVPDRPDLRLWSTIARAQARRGDPAGAKATAAEIKDERYRDVVWQDIALGSGEAGRLADAGEALAQIHDAAHRVIAACGLAVARFKAKDPAGARAACDAAKREMQSVPVNRRDALVSHVGHALARTATAAEAREFVDASLSRYNRVSAYASMAEALAERGDVAGALPLIDELRAMATGMDDVRDVADACRAVARAQAVAGQFDAARVTAAKAGLQPGESGPTVEIMRPWWEQGRAEILADLAEAEAAAGQSARSAEDLAAALDVLKKAKVAVPDPYGKIAALSTRAGRVDEACDLLRGCSTDPELRCRACARAAGELALTVNPDNSGAPPK